MPVMMEKEKKERKRRLTAPEVVRLQKMCYDRLFSELYDRKAYPGMPIAGARTLSGQYNIPLSVVRSTLDALRSEGVLESAPREGMRIVALPDRPQSLKGVRIAMIGKLELTHPDHIHSRPAVIAAGMDPILNRQGGKLDFFNLWKQEDPSAFVHRLLHSGYDAFIDAIGGHEADFVFRKEYPELSIPCISIDINLDGVNCVKFDDEQIGHEIARHALELGHRRTAFYHYTQHRWSAERLNGVLKEFAAWGVPAPDILEYPYFSMEEDDFVFRNFNRITDGKYTFVMAANDRLASYVYHAAKRKDMRIPEDFSLTGADDLMNLRDLNLTTVALRDMDLGMAVLELVKKKIFMPETCRKPEKVLVRCSLMIRNTTTKIKEISHDKG